MQTVLAHERKTPKRYLSKAKDPNARRVLARKIVADLQKSDLMKRQKDRNLVYCWNLIGHALLASIRPGISPSLDDGLTREIRQLYKSTVQEQLRVLCPNIFDRHRCYVDVFEYVSGIICRESRAAHTGTF